MDCVVGERSLGTSTESRLGRKTGQLNVKQPGLSVRWRAVPVVCLQAILRDLEELPVADGGRMGDDARYRHRQGSLDIDKRTALFDNLPDELIRQVAVRAPVAALRHLRR